MHGTPWYGAGGAAWYASSSLFMDDEDGFRWFACLPIFTCYKAMHRSTSGEIIRRISISRPRRPKRAKMEYISEVTFDCLGLSISQCPCLAAFRDIIEIG